MTCPPHRWRCPEVANEAHLYPSVCQLCGLEYTFDPHADEQKKHRLYNGSGQVPKLVRGKPKEWAN
jgi:hypothetical protein